MSSKTSERLTWAAVNGYGDRKRPGRLSIIVDVGTNEVYLVPRTVEHRDYLCDILRTTSDGLKQNPNLAERLIPVHIDLEGDTVKGIIVGLSGAEEFYGIRHRRKDIDTTKNIACAFVNFGELSSSSDLEMKVDYRYAKA